MYDSHIDFLSKFHPVLSDFQVFQEKRRKNYLEERICIAYHAIVDKRNLYRFISGGRQGESVSWGRLRKTSNCV